MILTDAVLNAYINANIMLIFAITLWNIIRFTTRKLRYQLPFIYELHLLNGVFLAILIVFTQFGLISPNFSMSISDFAVAQYLNGSIEMKATEFEQMLGLRDTFIQHYLTGTTNSGLIITGGFMLGFLALIGHSIVNIFKLRSILRSSYVWRQFGDLKILLSDTTFIPFSTRGLTTRYVVIPSGMLAESDALKMALGHEFQHIRQGDVEWAFILEALRPFFFWNPAFYFWKRQVHLLRELACDQQLVSVKKFDVQTYCECLINVCSNSISKNDKYSIALPTVPFVQVDRPLFGVNATTFLKQRVVAIVEPATSKVSHKAFTCLLLPCMALVVLACLTLQGPRDWSQDRLMLSAIVNLERLEIRNTLNTAQ